MKIAIVQFPGSNCERETALAVERSGMQPIEFLWNEPASKLKEMDGFIIVGGFSYEDRSRSGIIAALDPVMEEIKRQSELGKPVLGICNGAQILVETGLVPGLKEYQVGMALTENKRILDGKILGTGFYNAWINMRPCSTPKNNAFTRCMSEHQVITVPAAHAEGRFVMTKDLLKIIESEGLNLFQYCDEFGNINDNFPVNPNGSMGNIAAVINRSGNVMAMMPHPERTPVGDDIFKSMKEYIQDNQRVTQLPLDYQVKPISISPYTPKTDHYEVIVKQIITDNTALTVEKTLRQMGILVSVKRYVHWEIGSNSTELIEQIMESGVLYNDRKEYIVEKDQLLPSDAKAYLVKAYDDLVGAQKMQMLQDHFSFDANISINHGVLWVLQSDSDQTNDIERVLQTHILFNSYAHACYEY
ncbi:phosphoribosylformylglycinamidine synthase I [Legionella waltersii]|uniref:Phosphoribosylformylglycinamidine synthase I n=1 Tax=Legionella waltersii TaxID=66969 RepID=A0A0W1A1B8_9GAMM|nr:phosphoribosylformylglycinamidine synthase I [Legionella waltersii]KTD75159.1 phosphoribosylformylglycinamidine synthase I [Legionella waltersii]SNV04754.1 phosphoribosylformylglycinamidine synthase I [Legionella waltersii]